MMRPYVEEFSSLCPVWTSCHPNAGLPNEFGGYDETPEQVARTSKRSFGRVRAQAELGHEGCHRAAADFNP
jgi:methionine synthase I (cobalamin-dependent)